MKSVVAWVIDRWVWIAMPLLIAVLGYALFSTYAEKLPYVSSNHSAWASFGALLAGFFTLTSTLATVATLLFLARQNKEMQKVTQAQLAAMTFDRYISHRKLFIELLNEQEESLLRVFRFRDPTLLYNAVFPDNSLHNCALIITPEFDENGDGTNHLGKLSAKLERLKRALAKTAASESDHLAFVFELINLGYDLLMIEQRRDAREGDILFHSRALGLNVFMLDSFVQDAVKLANTIFTFTKSPTVDVGGFHACSTDLKGWVARELYSPRRPSELTVFSNNSHVPDLLWVRGSLAVVLEVDEAFINAKRRLDKSFASVQSVERLRDKAVLKQLTEDCITDVRSKFDKMSGGEHFELIGEISSRLHRIKNHL
ncbi:hypothetical protein [Pseudomonas sp. RC3H12]|uniref:hypothetical protein n=1 Tax=Pseudomonas sp. RC3H12 TaxID=2834406 RepID=UPI001BDF0436|nr:hypothetical protein [Pseudomonas sp. RC3H12]QWA30513.1 hypothetical protein KHO27_06455 [Pseudomonas sp. RC3H12]